MKCCCTMTMIIMMMGVFEDIGTDASLWWYAYDKTGTQQRIILLYTTGEAFETTSASGSLCVRACIRVCTHTGNRCCCVFACAKSCVPNWFGYPVFSREMSVLHQLSLEPPWRFPLLTVSHFSMQKRPVEDSDWRKNVEAMSGMEGRKKMFDAAKGPAQWGEGVAAPFLGFFSAVMWFFTVLFCFQNQNLSFLSLLLLCVFTALLKNLVFPAHFIYESAVFWNIFEKNWGTNFPKLN